MYTEQNFHSLIESQSLLKLLKAEEGKIKEQNDRLLKLDKIYQGKLLEQKELSEIIKEKRSNNVEMESKLAKVHQTLEQLIGNESQISSQQALDNYAKEKLHLEKQRDELEEYILNEMEEADIANAQLDELGEFIKNYPKSLSEIKQEVDQKNAGFQKEADQLRSRIKDLIAELPQTMTQAFKAAAKKFENGSMLAKIEERKCSICKFMVPQSLSDQVQNINCLEYCPSCQRLFVPKL